MSWFTYMLRCSDNSLYTGITNDVEKRLMTHQSGKGSKYVRSKLPVCLVYKEQHEKKHDAQKREIELKRWTKQQKEALIAMYEPR